jgi:transcriptional regulator with XRE-family HTH domain
MLTKEEMLEHPNYLLGTYQLEIYNQLGTYMEKNQLKSKDIADKLKVSQSYVSQVLNGNFNFTLKKLIELGLMIKKVPYLQFLDPDDYWQKVNDAALERKKQFLSKEQKSDITNASSFQNVTTEHFEKKYGAVTRGDCTAKFAFDNDKTLKPEYA